MVIFRDFPYNSVMTSEASRMEGVENIFFYGLEYEFRYESLIRFFSHDFGLIPLNMFLISFVIWMSFPFFALGPLGLCVSSHSG